MGVFTTSGAAARKAGANVSTSIPEVAYNEWISGAEAFINTATRKNWSDSYGTLNVDVKSVLSDTASNLAGAHAVAYDMSGYTSRTEAEDIITFLRDGALRGISVLRDIKTQEFIDGA